jgi:hypothetical protein
MLGLRSVAAASAILVRRLARATTWINPLPVVVAFAFRVRVRYGRTADGDDRQNRRESYGDYQPSWRSHVIPGLCHDLYRVKPR